MRIAKSGDWKTLPMPEMFTKTDLGTWFTLNELEQIKRGVIPENVEDKWFVYWEDDTLYFHRSRTGFCRYVVRFELEDDLATAVEADLNRDSEQYQNTDDDYDREIILFLIAVVLLRRRDGFPSDQTSKVKRALELFDLVGDAALDRHPGDQREPRFNLDAEAKKRLIELLNIEGPEVSTEERDVLSETAYFDLPVLSVPLAKIEKACRLFSSESVLEPLTKSESESLASIEKHSENTLTALDRLPVDAFVALDCGLEHSNEDIRGLVADLREAASASELGRVTPLGSSKELARKAFIERLVDTYTQHCALKHWNRPTGKWPSGRHLVLCEFLSLCVDLVSWEGPLPVASTQFYERFVFEAEERALRRKSQARTPQQNIDTVSTKTLDSQSERDHEKESTRARGQEPSKLWRVTIFYSEPTYDIRHGHEGREFREVSEILAVDADEAARQARLRFSRMSTASQVSWVREIIRISVEPLSSKN